MAKRKARPQRATDGGSAWIMRAKLERPGGVHGRRKPVRQAERARWKKDECGQ